MTTENTNLNEFEGFKLSMYDIGFWNAVQFGYAPDFETYQDKLNYDEGYYAGRAAKARFAKEYQKGTV